MGAGRCDPIDVDAIIPIDSDLTPEEYTKFAFVGRAVQIFKPAIILKPSMIRIGDNVRIDSFVKIEGGLGVEIGAYTHISSFSHINLGGGKLVLEMGFACGSGAKILSGTNVKSGYYMSVAAPSSLQVVIRGKTLCKEGSYVGSSAVIFPGVILGRFAIVGAGAVVTHNVPDYEIWAGVPAQRIGFREDRMRDDGR